MLLLNMNPNILAIPINELHALNSQANQILRIYFLKVRRYKDACKDNRQILVKTIQEQRMDKEKVTHIQDKFQTNY